METPAQLYDHSFANWPPSDVKKYKLFRRDLMQLLNYAVKLILLSYYASSVTSYSIQIGHVDNYRANNAEEFDALQSARWDIINCVVRQA